jgi:DNA-directed RNA polymerase subunit omega
MPRDYGAALFSAAEWNEKMSLMQPSIDELLEKTDNDKYLLCAVASKRSRDINEMMRGQRNRAIALQSATQIAQLAGRKPLSLAMEEIDRAEIGYNHEHFVEARD